jgi:putative ABC transport system ATP-binding protein
VAPEGSDTIRGGEGLEDNMAKVAEGPTIDLTTRPQRQLGPMAAIATGLTKKYGAGNTEVVALDHVDIGFEAGRLTAIMGPSGSGKSTLLHCVAGLDEPSGGEVQIGDTLISELSERALTLLRRERLGFIFQSFNLVPTLDAEENILLPLLLGGRDPDAEWKERVISNLGLSDRLHHRPDELSGGQQQRVAVARALVTRPEIIFADEPTGNLDSSAGGEVLGFLRRAVDDFDQTVVMVTHDPGAAAYADTVVFLRDGRLIDTLDNPTAEMVFDRIRALED